jgi:hypothetical protein
MLTLIVGIVVFLVDGEKNSCHDGGMDKYGPALQKN